MAHVETSVLIAAPPELVFAFFVPQRMAYWYGAEMETFLEVQGGAADFAVAQKVRITGHLGRREVSHTAVVTSVQPGQLFEWRFEDRYGVKGLERWEVEQAGTSFAQGSPRTTVRMRSEYAMPGLLGKAMDWLVTRHAVAKRNMDYLVRLKRLAEHGKPE
jgi:uncharacterized protein YndB with AHSA1/START domain